MDTTESSVPHAHPSTEEHDDTIEAHYASLERPHACIDGWVYIECFGELAKRAHVRFGLAQLNPVEGIAGDARSIGQLLLRQSSPYT